MVAIAEDKLTGFTGIVGNRERHYLQILNCQCLMDIDVVGLGEVGITHRVASAHRQPDRDIVTPGKPPYPSSMVAMFVGNKNGS